MALFAAHRAGLAPVHGTRRVRALSPEMVTCNNGCMATVNDRVSAYRRRMREQGFRPIQVWVPDTRAKTFADEARRQGARAAVADRHSDDQDFIEAVSVSWEDD